MPDPIETAVKAASRPTLELSTVGAAALAAVTIYGAASAIRDVTYKALKLNRDRKAKKALAETEPRRSEA